MEFHVEEILRAARDEVARKRHRHQNGEAAAMMRGHLNGLVDEVEERVRDAKSHVEDVTREALPEELAAAFNQRAAVRLDTLLQKLQAEAAQVAHADAPGPIADFIESFSDGVLAEFEELNVETLRVLLREGGGG